MEESTTALGDAARMLRNIQAITDEAFAHMELDDFLDALLDRLREVLDVDTATVLLLDRQARMLEATAAKGLEEEVVQGVRVPVGLGFAGRVAVERQPVYIEDVPTAGVFNPLLVERGLISLLGVPIIAGGVLLGVLHVGTVTARRFTDEEVELLQLAASRAAMAVSALLSWSERAAALELQRSLVPGALPRIPGLELAARFRPGAADVGGDWYDVFALPSGEIGIVMGDVAGHGLGSAVVMGRMRSALRSYALETSDPAEVLRRLNRKILHFEPTATATVLYAVCDRDLGRVRISCAGHYPPVIVRPGEPARDLDLKPDVLIGIEDFAPRRSTSVELRPGTLLAFYTDGLVERRDRPIHAGLEHLREAVFAGPPEAVSAAIMSALLGRHQSEDDVALLVVRRSPE